MTEQEWWDWLETDEVVDLWVPDGWCNDYK